MRPRTADPISNFLRDERTRFVETQESSQPNPIADFLRDERTRFAGTQEAPQPSPAQPIQPPKRRRSTNEEQSSDERQVRPRTSETATGANRIPLGRGRGSGYGRPTPHTGPPPASTTSLGASRTSAAGAGDALDDVGPTRQQLLRGHESVPNELQGQLRQECARHDVQVKRDAGTMGAGDCVAMARDNVLAQANGHGWALTFVNASQGGRANVLRLDHYLGHLSYWLSKPSAGPHAVDARTRESLRQCLDLSCHYLVKAGWFEGGDTRTLVHVANKLSKHVQRRACNAALSWVARAMTDERLRGADPKSLGMLANALSKNPTDTATGRAMQRLARCLVEDNRARRLEVHGLSSTLNALGKWPGDADCAGAASALAARLQDDAGLRRAMIPQAIANSLNALSKWPGDAACAGAAKQLALRVRDDTELRRTMSAQDVANSLNALSKWPGDKACAAAASTLAVRVHDDAALRLAMSPQQVANSLNAVSKWPEDEACLGAARRLATRVRDETELPRAMTPQEVANSLNALSKWPGNETCAAAASKLAVRLQEDAELRRAMSAQDVASSLDALGKWPGNEACSAAARTLAARLHVDTELQWAMNEQAVTNSLNALSRWPDDEACAGAAVKLAVRLSDDAALRRSMSAQAMANSLNGLGKWPDDEACLGAAKKLAERLRVDTDLRRAMSAKELANSLNALSKWPDDAACAGAASQLAARVQDDARLLQAMNAQQVATSLNALCKWPEDEACAGAASKLAERLQDDTDLRLAMNEQGMANSLNALSKWSEDGPCAGAASKLAVRLGDDTRLLLAMNEQAIANSLNGLSKWPGDEPCAGAATKLAVRLREGAELQLAMNEQATANSLNALSKWPEDEACAGAAGRLALRLCDDTELRRAMSAQHVTNSLNALSKWPGDDDCFEAALVLAQPLGRGRLAWGKLSMIELSQAAHALGRLARRADELGDAQAQELVNKRLRALADQVDTGGRLAQAETRQVGMILRGLHNAHLHDDLDVLAPAALQRLEELHQNGGFASDDLETTANVCAALLPLARSPKLKPHRARALRLLERMHEVVERKTDAFLRAQAGEPPGSQPGERWDTRTPGASLYLVLKAYQVVGGMYKRNNLDARLIRPGSQEDLALKQRSEEIQSWTRRTLDRADAVIKADLGSNSWNMIMQVESEFALDALDNYLFEHTEEIVDAQPPAQFDLRRVIDGMRHEPRPPTGDVGLSSAPVLDMQGRKVRDGDRQYSILAHLTEGQVLQAWVELPGPPSGFMLSRVIDYDGEKLRMDLSMGSKLKPETITLESIFSQDPQVPKGAQTSRKQGQLLAVRYADTAPGSAFSRLLRKVLGPFEEAAAYMQRALKASPPGVAGLSPHDHVLMGQFKIHQFCDRPGGQGHPVRLRDEQGRPICIAVHDGVMLVREDVALRMPVFAKASAQKMPAVGERTGVANVPPQALQHYGRAPESVVQETVHKLREQLQADPPASKQRTIEQRQLQFRRLTTGQMQGKSAVTIPSADDKLYLPGIKSRHIKDLEAGVLVGRSPYDKPNLRTFTADRVQTSPDDPTVKFLERCKSMQFSFVAEEAPTEEGAEPQMRFDKGVAVLVPSEWWPEEYADCHMLTTWENNKTRTEPIPKEDRVDGKRDCVGLFVCTDVFMEGSLYAMPVSEQERSDGDNDGDQGTIVGDRPELFAHIHAHEVQDRRVPHVSLKPVKTKTSAVDEQDRYRVGRGELLLNARKARLEEIYTNLKMRFEGLAPDVKKAVAEQALFGGYEGTERQLEHDIRALLDDDELSVQSLEPVIARAQQNVRHADHPVARVVADLLVEQLQALQAELRGDTSTRPQDERRVRDVIREHGLQQLFPELAEALNQAEDARERLQALVDKYPQRMEPTPDGHVRGDTLASMRNFLTLGIKIGTDKKTRSAVQDFARREGRLNKIMDTLAPGNRFVDYGKGTARRLNAGTYDHEEAKQRLARNPTLAAQLMEAAGDELLRHDPTVLSSAAHPQQTTAAPAAADPQARARELHEQAGQHEPAITQHVEQVARSCSAQRRDAERTLRSQESLRWELSGARERGGGAWKEPNALRYTLQLPPERFTEGFRQAMLGFDELGYAKVQVNNSFARQDPLFVGVSVMLEAEDGFRFSVQFHTEDSHRVKSETHDVHKQLQAEHAKAEPDTARIAQLQQTLRQACEPVPRPPAVQTIRDWHVDLRQGPRLRRTIQSTSQAAAVNSPARQLQAQARLKEEQITPVMTAVAAGCGARLRGNATYHPKEDRIEDNANDRHLKSVESIKHALKRLDDAGQAAEQQPVRDALRYAVVLGRDRFTDGVAQARQRLGEAGMQLVREVDFFAQPGTGGYRGLNTIWRDATGYEYEVQFHTPESFDAKAKAHVHYKVMQSKAQRLRKEQDKELPDAAKVDELQQAIATRRAKSEAVFGTVHPPSSA